VSKGRHIHKGKPAAQCAGAMAPLGDQTPQCGNRSAHYPHVIGEPIAYRTVERAGKSYLAQLGDDDEWEWTSS
jgi:hypothetical protein